MWKVCQRLRMPFYAVGSGRQNGIYSDWESCKAQVNGYSGARYKKFNTAEEAQAFIDSCRGSGSSGSSNNSASGHSSIYIPTYKQQNHYSGYRTNPYSYTKPSPSHSSAKYYSTDSSDDSSTTVYTDGSCFNNGQSGSTAGVGVYWGPSHPDNVSERLPGRQTNNRAEIHAARIAIRQAKERGMDNVTVITDSEFVIKGITSWIHNWKKNNWQTSNRKDVQNIEDWKALDKEIQGIEVDWVRGAPAIAIVGCLSLVVELKKGLFTDVESLRDFIDKKLKYLVSARPTAVNMGKAAKYFIQKAKDMAESETASVTSILNSIINEIEAMLIKDISENKALSGYGADDILQRYGNDPVSILTHCNTGSLATAGYGTALGVVRSLQQKKKLKHVYCTETRPYNQGARLTAYELTYEKMPATLICDSMASMLMQTKGVSAVVVGADRVVANGDTANKIGTYQLAIAAKYHNVPFYVACPTTSYDPRMTSGSDITIEERPHKEMTTINGISFAAPGINCWNPAFDITPASLITGGIITEFGVFQTSELETKLQQISTKRKSVEESIESVNKIPKLK